MSSAALAEQVAAVLAAATEDLIVATDPAGVVTVFNAGAERMLGYRAEDVVGRLSPLVWHDAAEVAGRSAELGVSPGFDVFAHPARHGSPDTRAWTFVRKDGSRLVAQLTVTPVVDAQGVLSGYLGIARDVTERERMEEALRRADAKYRDIVESAVEGIYQSTLEGRVLTANRALARLLGFASPEELVTTITDAGWQIYVDPRDRAALVGQVLEHGPAEAFECRVRRKDGRVMWILQNVRAVRDNDGLPRYLEGTVEDITARKQAEAEHARLEQERDQFFSSISHDLRTPLAAITASIGVVLANEPPGTPPVLHRLLVNIDEAADDMGRLVEDLLELTRLQAGRVELCREVTDLREVALRAAREIEPLAQARGQQVQLELPPEVLAGWVDTRRLGRVLLNLLGNATKYGREQGTIRLQLNQCHAGFFRDSRARACGFHLGFGLEAQPRRALFSVTDDGGGIPERDRERIFERFYRAETDATRREKGSGLGLPIARALVELHGGCIWVESAPGRGATFRVALPLEAAGQAEDGSA